MNGENNATALNSAPAQHLRLSGFFSKMAWNTLPYIIQDPTSSTDCFGRLVKTYLFARDTSEPSTSGLLTIMLSDQHTNTLLSQIPGYATEPRWLGSLGRGWIVTQRSRAELMTSGHPVSVKCHVTYPYITSYDDVSWR